MQVLLAEGTLRTFDAAGQSQLGIGHLDPRPRPPMVSLKANFKAERLASRRFVSSDYVVDETVTLLLIRHSHAAAADFLGTVERSEALRLEWIGPERFHAGAALFQRHADKEWSFTDCVSFALMRELRIRDAFTTDRHFRQAGFVPLLES